jgi:hypothetical protein
VPWWEAARRAGRLGPAAGDGARRGKGAKGRAPPPAVGDKRSRLAGRGVMELPGERTGEEVSVFYITTIMLVRLGLGYAWPYPCSLLVSSTCIHVLWVSLHLSI